MKNSYWPVLVIFSLLSGGYVGFQLALNSLETPMQQLLTPAQTQTLKTIQSVRQNDINTTIEPAHHPEQALQHRLAVKDIIKLPTEFTQYNATYALAATLDEARVIQQLQTVAQLSDIHAVVGLSRILFSRYIDLSAERTVAYFFDHYGSHEQHKSLILQIYHEWAFINPQAAAKSVAALENKDYQQEIILSLVSAPVFEQYNEVQLLAELLPPNLQQHARYLVMKNQGYEKSFDYYLSLSSRDPTRRNGLRSAIYDWARKDPLEALAQLSRLDDTVNVNDIQTMVLSMMAKNDGQAAIEQAVKLDIANKNNKLLERVLQTIASRDGRQAFELAEAHQGSLNNNIRMNLLARWAESDPKAAVSYWQDNLGLVNKQDAFGIATAYAAKFPEEALAWANEVELPKHVVQNMVQSFVDRDLNGAQNYLQNLISPDNRSDFIAAIVQQKSRNDLKEAQQWLEQFENEPGYAKANDHLMHNWINQDPQTAAAEVLTTPQGEKYINSLVHSWYRADPQSTRQWVLSINSDSLRDQALSVLIAKVVGNNRGLAEDLLNEVSSAQILRNIEQRIGYVRPQT